MRTSRLLSLLILLQLRGGATADADRRICGLFAVDELSADERSADGRHATSASPAMSPAVSAAGVEMMVPCVAEAEPPT